MAALLGRERIGLRETGSSVTVPDDPKAKLMYYLDSICSVLEFEQSPLISRLRRYHSYASLTNDEMETLVTLCFLISPDVLKDKVIFQSDALCKNLSNNFYEISAVRDHFMVTQSIVIGGQTCKVAKIMTYKPIWILRNWAEPMRVLSARMAENERERRRREQRCVVM